MDISHRRSLAPRTTSSSARHADSTPLSPRLSDAEVHAKLRRLVERAAPLDSAALKACFEGVDVRSLARADGATMLTFARALDRVETPSPALGSQFRSAMIQRPGTSTTTTEGPADRAAGLEALVRLEARGFSVASSVFDVEQHVVRAMRLGISTHTQLDLVRAPRANVSRTTHAILERVAAHALPLRAFTADERADLARSASEDPNVARALSRSLQALPHKTFLQRFVFDTLEDACGKQQGTAAHRARHFEAVLRALDEPAALFGAARALVRDATGTRAEGAMESLVRRYGSSGALLREIIESDGAHDVDGARLYDIAHAPRPDADARMLAHAPREALFGTSRTALGLALAVHDVMHGAEGWSRSQLAAAATKLLVARTPQEHAAAFARTVALANEHAALRAHLEGPRTLPVDDGTPLDLLGSALSGVSGIDGVLVGAHDAVASAGQRGASVFQGTVRARPELWLPTLVAETARVRELQPPQMDATLVNAAARVGHFRAQLGKVDASSSITKARIGSVAAGATALALLDLMTSTSPGDACGLLEHCEPALTKLVGRAKVAKNGPDRNPLLAALFELNGLLRRTPPEAVPEVRADIASALTSSASAAEATTKVRALCAALRAKHPNPRDLAAGLSAVVEGKRGGPGLQRWVERQSETYEHGVEAASLARIVDALKSGTLPETRRLSLAEKRFAGLRTGAQAMSRIFDAWSEGASTSTRALGLPGTVFDSGDATAWAEAVDDVISCQSTDGNPSYNRGLLNRFEDGSVRLVAWRGIDGKILARAAMRLVTSGPRDHPHLAVFVDSVYAASSEADANEVLHAFAAGRAKAIGLPFLRFADSGVGGRVRALAPTPLGVDYIDGGDGIVHPRDGETVLDACRPLQTLRVLPVATKPSHDDPFALTLSERAAFAAEALFVGARTGALCSLAAGMAATAAPLLGATASLRQLAASLRAPGTMWRAGFDVPRAGLLVAVDSLWDGFEATAELAEAGFVELRDAAMRSYDGRFDDHRLR